MCRFGDDCVETDKGAISRLDRTGHVNVRRRQGPIDAQHVIDAFGGASALLLILSGVGIRFTDMVDVTRQEVVMSGNFFANIWNIIWLFFWIFAFMAYLIALFNVIGDLFRDGKLNGWWKAL